MMLAEIIPRIAAESQPPAQPYYPRPSLAGPERCIRMMTYQAMDAPASPWPGRAMLVFDDSSWHEELTKDWIRKSVYRLHSEQMPVDVQLPQAVWKMPVCPVCKKAIKKDCLHGHIDGIITDLLSTDILFEHKGINHFSFERAWKGDWPLDNFTQTGLYIRGLQEHQPDIRRGLLLLKNKNTSAYLEFLLDYDREADAISIVEMIRSDGQRAKPQFRMEQLLRSTFEKFRAVSHHVHDKTLPARPFPMGTDYPCGYCRWGASCWHGYEQEFEELPKEVEIDDLDEHTCAYYLEESGHETRAKKQKKDLRQIILKPLLERQLRSARVGPYLLSREIRHRSTWDQEQIPPDVAAVAKVDRPYEILVIRRPKTNEPPAPAAAYEEE